MVVLLQCNTNETLVPLDENLSRNQSFVVSIAPSIGDLRARLTIKPGADFKGICSLMHSKSDSFPIPRYISNFNEIPPDSYFLLTHDEYGFTAYFCLSHQDQICHLAGGDEAGLILHIRSGRSDQARQERPVLVCHRGAKLQPTLHAVMALALQLTGNMGRLIEDKLPMPKWLGKLGWESGGFFGLDVSHENILNSVWSLRQEGFQPGFVLIDEGWQTLAANPKDGEHRALINFEADKHRFPSGLKGVVDELHRAGIKHIGVWHGIMGARGGIHPDLAKRYGLPCDRFGRYFLGLELGRTFEFFQDYYGYLRQQGIDFVRVGDQAVVSSFCADGIDSTLVVKNLQAAMQAAASTHFSIPPLNTDCLGNENIFYWSIGRLARAAECIDFQNPVGVMRAIRNNLTNSLWLQHIMQPDYDLWLSETPHKEMLAIFHALSGTINILSDPPGQHDKQLIRKMILPSGQVLLADKPLTLCQDSVFINPLETKQIYKAYTSIGAHGIIGAFNLNSSKRTLHGKISIQDVEGLKGLSFAVFSYQNGFLGLISGEDSLPITLKPSESDILTLAPVQDGIAVIGCFALFMPPRPITEMSVEDDSVHFASIVSGPMIVYCERQVLEIRRNGHVIPWEYDEHKRILSIDSRSNLLDGHSVYGITFES